MKPAAAIAAAILLIGALHFLAGRRAAGEAGLPLDDAWIHARLARTLAEGRGFEQIRVGPPVAPFVPKGRLREIARVFLRLGVVGFGGPAAHIALMRDELVGRRDDGRLGGSRLSTGGESDW